MNRYSNEGPQRGQTASWSNHTSSSFWLKSIGILLVLLMGGGNSENLIGATPQFLDRISPPAETPVIGMKPHASGVSVRLKDVGWVRHDLDGSVVSVLREGALDDEGRDFVRLPRIGNAVITDDNTVKIQAYVGVTLWEEKLDSNVLAFGVVGNVLEINSSGVFIATHRDLQIRETLQGADLGRFAPSEGLTAADVAPDMTTAVTAGGGRLTIFDVANTEATRKIEIGPNTSPPIAFLKILQDENLVVISDTKSRIETWNLSSGERVLEYPVVPDLVSINAASEGDTILIGKTDGTILAIQPTTGSVLFELEADSDDLQEVGFAPTTEDTPTVAWGRFGDGTLHRWNLDTGKLLNVVDGTKQPFWPDQLTLSANGRHALINDAFQEERFVYDLKDGTKRALPDGSARILPSGEIAVWTNLELSVWNYEANQPQQLWTRTFSESFEPRFLATQIEVSITNEDGETTIQSLASTTGKVLEERTLPPIVSLGSDTIPLEVDDSRALRMRVVEEKIWPERIEQTLVAEIVAKETGMVETELAGTFPIVKEKRSGSFGTGEQFIGPPLRVIDSWDGRLVAAGAGGTVRAWDRETGQLIVETTDPEAYVNRLVFNQDSQKLAVQFINSETLIRHNTIWNWENNGLREAFTASFEGTVHIRFTADTVVFEHQFPNGGLRETEYDTESGELLRDELGFDDKQTVQIRGNEPFRLRLKTLKEEETGHSITRTLQVNLVPRNGGNRWLRSLEGTLAARLGRMEIEDNFSLTISATGRGIWLEKNGLYVIGVGNALGVWEEETGKQLFTRSLDTGLPFSANTVGYRVRADRTLADDGISLRSHSLENPTSRDGHLLIVIEEQVFAPEEEDLLKSGRRFLGVLDLNSFEFSTLMKDTSDSAVFFDSELRRALVGRSHPHSGFDIWEVKTSSVVGTIPSSRAIAGGTFGRFGQTVELASPTFSQDGSRVAVVEANGISFWELNNLAPGLAIRRDESGLYLMWDHSLVDSTWILQGSTTVNGGIWNDIDRGENNELAIQDLTGDQSYFRWFR